ncbi:MAG TPA: ABC transporter ATP-binding protein [Chloroflexia bacterium]
MKRYLQLLRYAAPYRRGWALILVVSLLSTAFSLLQPWPMKVLVDNVLGGSDPSGILQGVLDLLPGAGSPGGLLAWVVLAGLVVFVANSAFEVALTFAWIKVGQRMVYNLAGDLFAHIQRRSLLFHSRNPVGDSLSRITEDSWSAYTVANALLFAPGNALVTMIGVLAIMLGMDAGLTLLSLAVAPFMAGSSLLLGKPIRAAAQVRRKLESRIQSHVQRTLSGISVVQAFGQEDRERSRFREMTRAVIRAHQWSTVVGKLYDLSSGLITTLGTAAILWVGARHVLEGSLTVGGLLVFISYLGLLQGQMRAFAGIYSKLQGASAGVDRVAEVVEVKHEVKDEPGARPMPQVEGHIIIENVTFGYEPGRPVLEDVYIEALPGQTIAIVGPTGAGKSTLAGLLMRFFDPWKGTMWIDGYDAREVQLRSLRSQVSLVLQEPLLLPITVAENIAYGRPDATMEEIEAAARAANAHNFIMKLPDGYDTILGERGGTLSGGERQRLSIARALLKDAPVLILDEPTSALDAETEGLLMEALKRLMQGRTTFIIAHRLSTIRNADRIVVMQRGRVAEAGTHEELMRSGGIYSRLYGAHLKGHSVREKQKPDGKSRRSELGVGAR